MKSAHAKFKITKTDFNNVWNNMEEAMKFYKVSHEMIHEVKGIFYSV
jgi:truncated hemoglobin YjbI